MSISRWQPGEVYIDGSLVLPTTVPGASQTVIPNADFEAGDSGFAKGTGWAINGNQPWAGSFSAEFTGTGTADIISSTKATVAPGKAVSAQCFVRRGSNPASTGAVLLQWYDGVGAPLSQSVGESVASGAEGVWKSSTVDAVAPPDAAEVAIGAVASSDGTAIYVDNFQWDYVTGSAPTLLVYKAIPNDGSAGTSGSVEPVWPLTVGLTVVDNDITWEAQEANTVTWQASSVLTSGLSEPVWPEEADAVVSDNNIAWVATPLRIEDPNCPHTKVVAVAASKVFAAGKDGNVVRFCATLNARDWTTEDDAGFLPTGLQQKSQVGVNVMQVYRSNLTVWSGSSFQVWQVDPDPSAMQLLDAMEGIGSIYQQAAQPVSDDLFFLAALGVRTVSIAAGAENLASGDIGKPIDSLIQAELGTDIEPHATYYPSAGQYWLAFRDIAVGLTLLTSQFLLTSPLYPIEFEDAIAVTVTPKSGALITEPLDALENVVTPKDGDLYDSLLSYTVSDEAIETTVTPQHGFLGQGLKDYTHPDEAIETTVTPKDGDLYNSVITYYHPDEAIETTVTPKDGALFT